MISGLLVAVIGAMEMLAWHLQWTTVLQINASYAPMTYNTALALLVTGLAIAFAVRGPTRWLRVAGILDVMLGAPGLAREAVGRDLHIDELFVRAHLVSSAEHPGRLAINTAICLMVMGAGLLIWRPDAKHWRSPALIVAGAVVTSIAVVALFGYLAGMPSAYNWRQLTPMPLPTALAMALVAASMLGLAAATSTTRVSHVSEWIAVPAGTAAFAITLILWQVFADMGDSTTISAAEASRAALFLSLLTGGMLALMTWLAQHANGGRHAAQGLTKQLREEMARREQAELSVRESQLLLSQFLDGFPVGLFICDPIGRPYFANQAATTMLGQGADSAVNMDELATAYQTFVAGTDKPYPPGRLPVLRAAAGESSHVDDVEVHRPDGVIPLEIWGTPMTDESGRVRFGLAAFVDISQRRKTEKALARQAALLDIAHDVVYVKDADHRITYWNRGAENTYGWTREEAVGQIIYELLKTEFPEPFHDVHGIDAVLRRDGLWDGELVQHTKSGERTVVSSRFVAEMHRDGSLATIMALNTDITARKTAEAELARHAAELQALNLELSRSNDELEQFAYIASHDLSEPLRAISGPISLLARRYEGQLDDDADRFIGFAVDGCERMQALINDLLAFSRIGRQELEFVDVDTNAVVDNALDAVRVAIGDSDGRVSRDALPHVWASETQLRQVFQNLIANAIKFATPGTEPRVRIRCQRAGDDWCFSVTDNGIGIDAEHRLRIFGMFKRLHTRTAYPGTGIGLALCKKIVERHGGTIGVDDGPLGHGSTFWFTLPRREES